MPFLTSTWEEWQFKPLPAAEGSREKKQEGKDSGKKRQKIIWDKSCNLFIMLGRICLYEVYIITPILKENEIERLNNFLRITQQVRQNLETRLCD